MEALYVVRAFRTGPGLDPQFWLLMAAVCLVAWDVRARHRWDYAWVLFIGAGTWTLVELTLQLTAMRVMPVRTLFGNALPLHESLPLQGAAEGGALAVIGLFLGDRLLFSKTRAAAAVMLLVLSGLALLPVLFPAAEIGEVFSRRNMLAGPSLLFCGLLVAVDFVFLLRWRVFRLRATAMFSVLAILGGCWTVAVFVAGGRWIEFAGVGPGTYARGSTKWQVCGLSYDVVVELAFAYVAFLALPAMCGLIAPRHDDQIGD